MTLSYFSSGSEPSMRTLLWVWVSISHCSAWFGSVWPDLDWLRMWTAFGSSAKTEEMWEQIVLLFTVLCTNFLVLYVCMPPCVCAYVCVFVLWPVFHSATAWLALRIVLPWQEGCATLSAFWIKLNRTQAESRAQATADPIEGLHHNIKLISYSENISVFHENSSSECLPPMAHRLQLAFAVIPPSSCNIQTSKSPASLNNSESSSLHCA